jgi:hypothetical protein
MQVTAFWAPSVIWVVGMITDPTFLLEGVFVTFFVGTPGMNILSILLLVSQKEALDRWYEIRVVQGKTDKMLFDEKYAKKIVIVKKVLNYFEIDQAWTDWFSETGWSDEI